jgi:hypothetical protein
MDLQMRGDVAIITGGASRAVAERHSEAWADGNTRQAGFAAVRRALRAGAVGRDVGE